MAFTFRKEAVLRGTKSKKSDERREFYYEKDLYEQAVREEQYRIGKAKFEQSGVKKGMYVRVKERRNGEAVVFKGRITKVTGILFMLDRQTTIFYRRLINVWPTRPPKTKVAPEAGE